MKKPSYKHVSDFALLVELGTSVDDDVNRLIVELDRAIDRAHIAGVTEVIPAMVNLLIVFDPVETDHITIQSAVDALLPLDQSDQNPIRTHVIKVCYDDGFGPDLKNVASACDMSVDTLLQMHCDAEYRVSMYGFAPGFAYMSGVPKIIQVPRKAAAVRDIPAGSVIIAGPQCLTTTQKMPTGWSIIGRSDANILTNDPDRPFLFDVGDIVRFQRVRSDELEWVAQ